MSDPLFMNTPLTYICTNPDFPAICTKMNNLCDFLFTFLGNETVFERDLLLQERTCSNRSRLPLRMETKIIILELLPLKVNKFTLIYTIN